MELNIFDFHEVQPLAAWGITHKFFACHLDTLSYSWVGMALLFLFIAYVRTFCFEREGLVYNAVESVVLFFMNLCAETIGYFRYNYFAFISSIFTFTLISCLVGLLPYLDEATKDANTTFALSISSFIFVASQAIRKEGTFNYLKHYLGPKELPLTVRILFAPLETVGQLSRILSMSFRLFGNVLGGGVVYHMLVGLFASINSYFLLAVGGGGVVWLLLFRIMRMRNDAGAGQLVNILIQCLFIMTWVQVIFGIAESLIQSFVVAMLSITYLSLTVTHKLSEDEEGVAWQS